MLKWMAQMNVIKVSVFILLSSLINNYSFATEAGSFRLTQTSIELPTITTWIDIADDNEQRIEIKAEQLSATLGSNATTIKSVIPFSKVESGTAFIFLIDVSKSLKPVYFTQMQSALNAWVSGMGNHDQAALISFGSQVKVLQDFSNNKLELSQKIDILAPNNMDTFLYQGLVKAFELGRRQDAALPKRRVIVVLTDGIDDAAGGVTKEEVFIQMAENRIPIYAIGYSMPPLTPIKENGLKELGVLARTSGGHFLKANAMPLLEAYTLQKERINNSYEVALLCNTCKAEGQLSRLNITYSSNNRSLNDGADVRLLPVGQSNTKIQKVLLSSFDKLKAQLKVSFEKHPYLSIAALVLFLIILIGGLSFFIKRRRVLQKKKMDAILLANIKEENHIDTDDYTYDPFSGLQKSVKPISPKYNLSFTVVTGDEPGKCFTVKFNESATIGRVQECDLCISDSEVSARHAEVKFEKGVLIIKDLNSTNGTLINGVPIHTVHYLQDGDQILIGRTELRLNGLEDSNAN